MSNFAVSFQDTNNNRAITADAQYITVSDYSNYATNTEAGHKQTDFADFRKVKFTLPNTTTYLFSSLGDGDASTNAASGQTLPMSDIYNFSSDDGVFGVTLYSLPTWATFTTVSGTAQGGSTTEIFLHAGASAVTGFYVGMTLVTTGGTGSGQTRQILAYDGVTKYATVTTWAVNPDNTTTYDIDLKFYYATFPYVYYSTKVYKALQDSTNQNPATATAYWEEVTDIEDLPTKYRLYVRFSVIPDIQLAFANRVKDAFCTDLLYGCNWEKLVKNANYQKAAKLDLGINYMQKLMNVDAWSEVTDIINRMKTLSECDE